MAVPNTDNIETTTLRLVRRRLADNIFKANPTSAWFLARGRVRTEPGGQYIPEPLKYAKNQTVMAYRGYDRLNVAPTEEVTQAEYNWRQMAVSIAISGEEELMNNGPSAIFKLLTVKIECAEKSAMEFFDEKIHALNEDKNTNKDFLGLDEIIDRTLNYSTLGGIDGNTFTFWRNQLGADGDGTGAMPFDTTNSSGEADDPTPIAAGSSTQLTEVLNRGYHNAAKGSMDKPDLILTSQAVYERYENDSLDKRRLMSNDEADLGFESIKFKGARIMWNENMVDGSNAAIGGNADQHPIYFINSDYMSFVLHQDRNFAMTPFVSPWDQDARVAQILMAGNMTCSNRRRLGVHWVELLNS